MPASGLGTPLVASTGQPAGRPATGEWWNGRHAGFRCQCAISAWGFKSPLAHKTHEASSQLVAFFTNVLE
jgi:hypothetical protein